MKFSTFTYSDYDYDGKGLTDDCCKYEQQGLSN